MHFCKNKKVVLTGATGLIGKEAITTLLAFGFEVFAISSKNLPDVEIGVNWIKADLLNQSDIKKVFEEIKPDFLLHFAWDTRPQIYLEDNSNFDWLKSSLEILKQFHLNGGKRAVFAGTCAEYASKNTPLQENDELNPISTYAKCKNQLNQLATLYCKKNNISFGWGRIFYVYGQNEQKQRLTPYITDSLNQGKKVLIKNGELVKDYMYAKDIAGGFVKFLDTEITGCVNICSAKPVAIKEYALTIARKFGKENFIECQEEILNQPSFIVGDNSRLLNEVGYGLKYTLDMAIDEIIKDMKNE